MRSKPEHNLQVQIITLLRMKGYTVLSIPNGGSRNALEGANLKREGVLAGAADLIVVLQNGRVVWLEVKSQIGRQSKSQKEFEKTIKALGHRYYVVRSLEEVMLAMEANKENTTQSITGSV